MKRVILTGDDFGLAAPVNEAIEEAHRAGVLTAASLMVGAPAVDDAVARPWLEDQIGSLAMHRLPDDDRGSSSERPKPILRFADDDEEHPLGRLLTFQGGRFASSYRVKDDQITVVNRQAGPRNFTITVLDNERNPDGLFLPHSYTVQYSDAATAELRRPVSQHTI